MTVVHRLTRKRGEHDGAVEIDRAEPHVIRERRRRGEVAGGGLLVEAVADHQPDRQDEHHEEEQHGRREQHDGAERACCRQRSEGAAAAACRSGGQGFSDRHERPPARNERGSARGIARSAANEGGAAGIEEPSRSPQTRTGTPTERLRRGEAALVSDRSKRHAISPVLANAKVAGLSMPCRSQSPDCRQS